MEQEEDGSTQDNLQKEVDHLARVLKQNGYPANFIRDASTPPMQETADASGWDEEQEKEKEPLVVIPYVAGMSEGIRRVCRKFNIRVDSPLNVDQGQGCITSW